MKRWWCLGIFLFSITSAVASVYAPVTELSTIEPLPSSGKYRVQADDTLYSIAWRYGLDYRTLAVINHIPKPYHIEMGQWIYLKGVILQPEKTFSPKTAPSMVVLKKTSIPVEKEPSRPVSFWSRPANGQVIGTFSGLNKGIDMSGRVGDPIYPAAPGKVVYSGNGLRGYGNLIILKHNSLYLSAYAYNQTVLVKEGDWVRRGQKIAEMGRNSAGRPMLHFEIRYQGKPVDPLKYIR